MGIHDKFELLLKIFFNCNDLKEDIKSPLGDLGVKKVCEFRSPHISWITYSMWWNCNVSRKL